MLVPWSCIVSRNLSFFYFRAYSYPPLRRENLTAFDKMLWRTRCRCTVFILAKESAHVSEVSIVISFGIIMLLSCSIYCSVKQIGWSSGTRNFGFLFSLYPAAHSTCPVPQRKSHDHNWQWLYFPVSPDCLPAGRICFDIPDRISQVMRTCWKSSWHFFTVSASGSSVV